MKKLLILALISLFSFEIKANDTASIVSDIKSTITKVDTASLSKQIYTDFKSGIEAAASALKVGVTEVWSILVKQQYVNSIMYLCLIIFGILTTILFFNQIKKCREDFKKWKENDGKDSYDSYFSSYTFTSVISEVITLILFGIGLGHIDVIITGFVNPQYGAMQDIINFVK